MIETILWIAIPIAALSLGLGLDAMLRPWRKKQELLGKVPNGERSIMPPPEPQEAPVKLLSGGLRQTPDGQTMLALHIQSQSDTIVQGLSLHLQADDEMGQLAHDLSIPISRLALSPGETRSMRIPVGPLERGKRIRMDIDEVFLTNEDHWSQEQSAIEYKQRMLNFEAYKREVDHQPDGPMFLPRFLYLMAIPGAVMMLEALLAYLTELGRPVYDILTWAGFLSILIFLLPQALLLPLRAYARRGAMVAVGGWLGACVCTIFLPEYSLQGDLALVLGLTVYAAMALPDRGYHGKRMRLSMILLFLPGVVLILQMIGVLPEGWPLPAWLWSGFSMLVYLVAFPKLVPMPVQGDELCQDEDRQTPSPEEGGI